MTFFLVIISLSILIFVHELGHFLFAKYCKMPVEEFCIGFPPRLWKRRVGETLYSVGALPFGGFVKITGENGEEVGPPPVKKIFSDFSFYKKSLVILAGVFFNILAGFIALAILFGTGIPKHLLITNIAESSPAEIAGLKSGDIIVEARFDPAIGGVEPQNLLRDPISTQAFIEFTKKEKGKKIFLEVLRDKKTISIDAETRAEAPEGQGALGVELVEIGFDAEPFPKNIALAAKATGENLVLITQSFFELITGILTRPEIAEGVAGPVGIVGIAARAGNLGIPYLIQLMALISLNLAVLNLIPFPALDGGRFLFLIIEKIIRRPLSFKIQAIANTAGFAILILLMVLVTIKDIAGLAN